MTPEKDRAQESDVDSNTNRNEKNKQLNFITSMKFKSSFTHKMPVAAFTYRDPCQCQRYPPQKKQTNKQKTNKNKKTKCSDAVEGLDFVLSLSSGRPFFILTDE